MKTKRWSSWDELSFKCVAVSGENAVAYESENTAALTAGCELSKIMQCSHKPLCLSIRDCNFLPFLLLLLLSLQFVGLTDSILHSCWLVFKVLAQMKWRRQNGNNCICMNPVSAPIVFAETQCPFNMCLFLVVRLVWPINLSSWWYL